MNAVEIEEAVSELSRAPFDPAEFPFAFLTAFGNKATTVNRLRTPSLNKSDVAGGLLQARNIHLAVCAEGRVRETMAALKASPKTVVNKVKFLLATDGVTLEAEDLVSDEPPIVCNHPDLHRHFGFFLPLAGISTVRAIKNNPIDIKATGRLNKLYVELLKDNPEWATEARRHEMNQFMARLIFCFFAEDTGIFLNHLFTKTIEQMSDSQPGPGGFGNTHEVLRELFRAMDTGIEARKAGNFRPWADAFPFVNGGLFTGGADCPHFSRIARSYLLRAAELNWQEINPDIFGSMIQAVADDAERGELGMHYTSVPNILKVLNPLFLDDLREQLEAAGDNLRKLRNLRKRLSTIRVFDPACGSGNFLVIAYREMRQIEHEIVRRTGDKPKSVIPLSNFYGIEIKGFAAEIARLALLIAEFQCDVRLISQTEARLNVLPLHRTGQIHIGNALRLDWLEVCPQEEPADLSSIIPVQNEIDFSPKEFETYVCGNPPYLGSQWRSNAQQVDMDIVFRKETSSYKDLDYVAAWYLKAAEYCSKNRANFSLVATKTICQGIQVAMLWPLIFKRGLKITFAHRPFTWRNLAKAKAGVTCIVIGVSSQTNSSKRIFDGDVVKVASNIGPYLLDMPDLIVQKLPRRLDNLPIMDYGNKPSDGGNLIFEDLDEATSLTQKYPDAAHFIRRYMGSQEFVRSLPRYCLWIDDKELAVANRIPPISRRLEKVRALRTASKGKQSNDNALTSHRFVYAPHQDGIALIVPRVTSENRPYLPCGIIDANTIVADTAAVIYSPPTWALALIASRLHQQWIATVCVRLRTDYRYSNTLGWNTFPVPPLTEKNKSDLTRCAEDILLAREAHFPATIADLYDPDTMPDDLRAAHECNDETLERIYVGRRFRNDTERLEKLFEMYTRISDRTASKKKTLPH